MLRITILRRGVPEQVVDLRNLMVRIGRGADNEVLLADPERTVSRNHARIVRTGDDWIFIDHGTHNGSWMRGAAVDRVKLAPGVCITLGDYELRCDGTAQHVARAGEATTRLSAEDTQATVVTRGQRRAVPDPADEATVVDEVCEKPASARGQLRKLPSRLES